MLTESSVCPLFADHVSYGSCLTRLADRVGAVLCLFPSGGDFFFCFFYGGLKVLFHHFDFLLNHIQLRLNRLPEVVSRIFEALNGFSDLPSDFGKLLWPEEEKGDH
jgi:hypothetical protein